MAHPTITLRTARLSDLAAVDALLARAYPRLLAADYPPSVMVTAVPLIARARPALLASGTYHVAEDETGAILAAGGWTPSSAGRGGVGQVRHVVTDDRHARRGIGRALLTRVLDEARESGVAVMDCLSTRTAVPFYAAMGFQGVGAIDITLAPGIAFPAVRMIRRF
jgi:GNAT superfamily N-acetyltransferase